MGFGQERQVGPARGTWHLMVTKLCPPPTLLFFLKACSHTKGNSVTKPLHFPSCSIGQIKADTDPQRALGLIFINSFEE